MFTEPVLPRLAGIGDEAAAGLFDQLAAFRDLGWSAIELRTVDGIPMADLDSRRLSHLARSMSEAELDVVCLASRIGNWSRPISTPFTYDLRELDVLAEQCATFGTRFIRIMSYPNDGLPENEWRERVVDRIARLTEQAVQHGLVLLHENCSGWAGAETERLLFLLNEVNSPSLRLLFDTGNGIEHGYDAFDMLGRILPHIAHVHVKDAVGASKNARYVPPGDGNARVADCLRLLLGNGYSGAFSLEPHLATRPHDGQHASDSAGSQFVQAGQRLETLLRTEVLPTVRKLTSTVTTPPHGTAF